MAEVNIDVAKESTGQQILSTVNNGAKESTSQQILSNVGSLAKENTSQEILSKLESSGGSGGSGAVGFVRNVAFEEISPANGFKTLLNITGKGKLCFAVVNGVSCNNSKVSIKVTLDNNVICFLTGKCLVNDYSMVYLGCFSYKRAAFNNSGANFPANDTYGVAWLVPAGGPGITKVCNFLSSEQTVSTEHPSQSGYVDAHVWLEDDIPFTKNLKVEYLVEDTSVYGCLTTVGYILEE